jgi:predicted enzyme related to lactoylglutathione lyase
MEAHHARMRDMTARVHTIDWVDLSTPDADGARAFYGRLLGWTYETSSTGQGSYAIAMTGGHQAAGMMASAPASPAPPSWTVYVRVADAHESAAACAAAGGQVVVPPFDIPGGALVAVLADPSGAVLAVLSGGPEPGSGEPPLRRDEPGAVAWCELMTRDPHAALSFYDAVFGWDAVRDPSTGYSTLRSGDVTVGGLLPMPDEVPPQAPSHWQVYFGTDDLDRSVGEVVAAGGQVLRPPAAVAGFRFAIVADPCGATFGLLSSRAS